MKSGRALVTGVLAVVAGTCFITNAGYAQQTDVSVSFPDVKENHWAYKAVQDLADKGLVNGYPDGKFLGDRALSRYEFATVIERLLNTIAEIQAGTAPANVADSVTQDDLNKIQVLVDKFQPQLEDIKANVAKAKSDIETLRQNIADLRQDVQDAKDLATKAQDTANSSYGFGSKRKFQISGYLQARYIAADSHEQTNPGKLHYPYGVATLNSPVNGTYAANANSASFLVRRARIKFGGQVSQHTRYLIHIDASSNSSATPVTVREGWLSYTTNNGDPNKNATVTAGIFPNPFGYLVPLSTANHLSPERPFAFNEGTTGLFNGVDYDKGVQVQIPSGRTKFTAAFLNGSGFGSGANPATDTDRDIDQVLRVAYTGGKTLSAGVSYDNGRISYLATPVGTPYSSRKRQLAGLDAQFTPTPNIFLNGEWLGGTYEQRTYFAGTTQPGLALTTNGAPGNKVDGYYLQGGYIVSPTGNHPLTLGASYDTLRRSKSGAAAGATGGPSGSSFDDVNLGYGILYNLDASTRMRLWYIRPSKVAHASTAVDPQKVGLFTSELQVRF